MPPLAIVEDFDVLGDLANRPLPRFVASVVDEFILECSLLLASEPELLSQTLDSPNPRVKPICRQFWLQPLRAISLPSSLERHLIATSKRALIRRIHDTSTAVGSEAA